MKAIHTGRWRIQEVATIVENVIRSVDKGKNNKGYFFKIVARKPD